MPLADRLAVEGVSERTVNRLLHDPGYSLQANRKTLEGRQPGMRSSDAPGARGPEAGPACGDTKKKEIQYRNGGREWRPKGDPEAVNVLTSPIRSSDPLRGLRSHRQCRLGQRRARHGGIRGRDPAPLVAADGPAGLSRCLLITADGSSRNRLWKLQHLADELGLKVSVAHFPPGK